MTITNDPQTHDPYIVTVNTREGFELAQYQDGRVLFAVLLDARTLLDCDDDRASEIILSIDDTAAIAGRDSDRSARDTVFGVVVTDGTGALVATL